MALGTQQVPIRAGIPVHQHNEADEVLFVLDGVGFGILGDNRVAIEKGSAIYVPTGVWHGVERIPTVSYCYFGSWRHRASKRSFVRYPVPPERRPSNLHATS